MLLQKIKSLANNYRQEFINIRNYIHSHPELSYHEFETSALIQNKLKEYGIPFTVMATTGVVGIIKGKNPDSRIVALRADIDALPIKEANEVDYKSKNEGIMHACGHDVHTTCLLGASKILEELKQEWEGTIKLIFQPGEEKNPGGASLMIKKEFLKIQNPKLNTASRAPILACGKNLVFEQGKTASADATILPSRKGGIAAPHRRRHHMAPSQIVVNLQQIIFVKMTQ